MAKLSTLRFTLIAAAVVYGAAVTGTLATSAQADTLETARKAGSLKVGLANQPPYSTLNPDGTIGGLVPTVTAQILKKLGIDKVEGSVATYGELVPGMQAGRWDMIAAAFRLSKERCNLVRFTDPITFDGGAIAYVKDGSSKIPDTIAALGASGATAGVLQGSYLVKLSEDKGVKPGTLSQFPNNPALIDGLLTKRVAYVVSTYQSLKELQRQRRNAFEIAYPLSDDPPVGSAPAFRKDDAAFHEAFQRELRAMRASGELDKLREQFGFDRPPPEFASISGEQACARLP